MRNSGVCRPRLIRSSRTARQAASLSPPMFLIASSTFWPSSRTPSTTSSEIEVALRSSRTRTTVPSRIRRTIGSSASERAFQASQSVFTLRHTRLTMSLPTRPRKRPRGPAYPPCVGAGEIRAGDQSIGGNRAPLVGPQRLALPLRRLAVRREAWRAARRSRSARTCRSATACDGRGDGRQRHPRHRRRPLVALARQSTGQFVFRMVSIKSRTRPRTPSSIGSNQLSKSTGSAEESAGYVVVFLMAWSPFQR